LQGGGLQIDFRIDSDEPLGVVAEGYDANMQK
jgi:hypothetical protein